MNFFSKNRSGRLTPVQILSLFCLVIPVFCIFVFLFTRSPQSPSPTLGPLNKNTVFNVTWTNALPAERTAYVYTFLTGRYDDTQRLIATLVSIDALRLTGTTRDIVVIVDSHISLDHYTKLLQHGAIIHNMPKHLTFQNHHLSVDFNPSTTSTSPNDLALGEFCYSNFAPIYAFSLYEKYDRVVWLDADVIPQLNMDELFLCGEFCMTYSNLQWYIASLLVLKPSQATFNRLMLNLNTDQSLAQKLRAQTTFFFKDATQCQELFEEYLLAAFYHIESAPLFDSESPVGQQHVPMMRLNVGYCMNPIYWYEHYDWHLARGKAYAHMTSESEYSIPGHAIAWPRVKPYNWLMGIYWNMNWVWAHWRRILLQESFFGIIATCVIISTILYVFIMNSIDPVMAILSKQNNSTFQHICSRSASFMLDVAGYLGTMPVGIVIATLVIAPSGTFAYLMLPSHTIYYVAWPVFIIVGAFFQHTALEVYSAWLFYAINGPKAWIESNVTIARQYEEAQRSPQSQEKYTAIQQYSDKVINDPLSAILFFLHNNNGTLSPLAQKMLITSLTSIKQMLFNMLLAAAIYGINQYHIYPHFAVKILFLFLQMLYFLSTLVKPYTTLLLIGYYARDRKSY